MLNRQKWNGGTSEDHSGSYFYRFALRSRTSNRYVSWPKIENPCAGEALVSGAHDDDEAKHKERMRMCMAGRDEEVGVLSFKERVATRRVLGNSTLRRCIHHHTTSWTGVNRKPKSNHSRAAARMASQNPWLWQDGERNQGGTLSRDTSHMT